MTEAWLRGPVAGIPAILQPVAHSLVQVREDVTAALERATASEIWAHPGGSAAMGFHAAHLAGSLDRLFTYARGEALSPAQREALVEERRLAEARPSAAVLIARVDEAVTAALAQLARTDAAHVLDAREVGRGRLPSTVLGLLFHAAEHCTRHAGQIATLGKVVQPPAEPA